MEAGVATVVSVVVVAGKEMTGSGLALCNCDCGCCCCMTKLDVMASTASRSSRACCNSDLTVSSSLVNGVMMLITPASCAVRVWTCCFNVDISLFTELNSSVDICGEE